MERCMVMKMNKTEFIHAISEKTGYDIEKSTQINYILESNFFISKKNKDKIINALMNELNIEISEADNIYNICIEIITSAIKNKIRHPFRSKE